MQSEVISGTDAIRGHQRPSEAIGCNQRQSEAIHRRQLYLLLLKICSLLGDEEPEELILETLWGDHEIDQGDFS